MVRLLVAAACVCALLMALWADAGAASSPAAGGTERVAGASAKQGKKARGKAGRRCRGKAAQRVHRGSKRSRKRTCRKPRRVRRRHAFRLPGRTVGDVDGDGIPNSSDGDVDGDGTSNRFDDDIDGDGLLNAVDREMDGDGILNADDRDIDADQRLNTADYDADADRQNNDYDHDIDGDGVENAWDADSDSSGDAALGSSGAVPARPGFVGLNSDDAFWGTDADPGRGATMAAIAGMGVGALRAPFLWSTVEPRPGGWEWRVPDGFVEAAARRGLSVLPVLFDPPAYASSRPATGAARGVYPPASNAAFGEYAAGLVRRYGPGGSFWRAHPELPQVPIRAWQIWNEPNIPVYWPAGPNPAAYTALLRAASASIKAVDPGARIVTAGLNDSELGIKLSPFLQGMYAAGAKDSFDVLGIHPYAPASDLVIDQISAAVGELARAGDDARVMVTEVGWATAGPPSRALVVNEAGQANLIQTTLARLARLRDQLRLDGVFYFNWRDVSPAPGVRDQWGLHTGLLRENGSRKPAFDALAQATRLVSGG